MRLFIALDIDDAIRERIALFMDGVRGFAPDARWVRPESLHVTVKFIGEQPEPAVERIRHELQTIRTEAATIQFRGYGFFPTAKSPRVFWLGIKLVLNSRRWPRRSTTKWRRSESRRKIERSVLISLWRAARALRDRRAGARVTVRIAPFRRSSRNYPSCRHRSLVP